MLFYYCFKINAFKVDKKTYQPMGILKYGIKTIIIRHKYNQLLPVWQFKLISKFQTV